MDRYQGQAGWAGAGRGGRRKGGISGGAGDPSDLNDFLQQHYQQQQDYTSLFYYYNQYLNFAKLKIQKSDNFQKSENS